jgi:hypothetical protein
MHIENGETRQAGQPEHDGRPDGKEPPLPAGNGAPHQGGMAHEPPRGEPPHGEPPRGEPPHGEPPHGEPPHGGTPFDGLLAPGIKGLQLGLDSDQLLLLAAIYLLIKDGADKWLILALAYIMIA